MFDVDKILALPLRALDHMTKRLVVEAPDGSRFYLVGGKDPRPLARGAVGFSPWECLTLYRGGVAEEGFMAVLKIKRVFHGSGVDSVSGVTGDPGTT